MLAVKDLIVERGRKKLFGPLAFNVNAGSVLWVSGPNGVGKTSLLKILSGLLQPFQGFMFWKDKKIAQNDPDYLSEVVYLGHALGLHALLTPLEYLTLSVTQARGNIVENAILYRALQQAGLTDVQYKLCGTLSRGQQQRLSLARFLVQSGRCWLMDEPLSGLDIAAQEWVLKLISDHIEQGGIAVVVSHDPLRLAHAQHQTLRL